MSGHIEIDEALEARQDATDYAKRISEDGFSEASCIILNALTLLDGAVIQLEKELHAAQEALRVAEEKFTSHTAAVGAWLSELADVLGLEGDGPFKPEDVLNAAIRGRQWASDAQSSIATLRKDAELLREELEKCQRSR